MNNKIISYCMFLLLIFASSLLSSCSTVNYDQQADQQITSLTQEINLQFITWKNQVESRKLIPYDTKFYDKVQSDIAVLQIRMEAPQDTADQKIASTISSISDQIQAVRNTHKSQNNLSLAFIQAELNLLNAQLASLTTFELSLKSSQSSSSSGETTDSLGAKNSQSKANTSDAKNVVQSTTKSAQ
ncbi:hypothetical protein [Burkholderia sp. GS2Y]|uniref:Lipoprotein n=1 Tax=Burkholderia theae TaxID=3143496 RepID=A0ABU9WM81_9BURK